MALSQLVFLYCLQWIIFVPVTKTLSTRGGIMVANYEEIILMKENGFDYMHKPLIITDSPMQKWTLRENIDKIYPSDYEITVKSLTTNCSCFGSRYDLCHQFASSFLYTAERPNYYHWTQFEGLHKESSKYMHCIDAKKEDMLLRDIISGHIKQTPDINQTNYCHATTPYNDYGMDSYMKQYSYLRVFGMKHDREYIDSIQLETLDHISLNPYFSIFNMKGFRDIKHIHLWFSKQYYRAMRHYDKNENLFFVLKGSRKFRVSKPTINVFPLFPFDHASRRQQMPYYGLLEDAISIEGTVIPQTYEILEAEIYENELFYLPCYWYHEVINNNYTVALNVWWDSLDLVISHDLPSYQLPINYQYGNMTLFEIDGFFYFIQRFIESWCHYVDNHEDRLEYILKCNDPQIAGFGFLLSNFRNIYRILDDLEYDTFEWMAITVDLENILKCTKDRVLYETLEEFKYNVYQCLDFDDDLKEEWDEAIDGIMSNMMIHHTNIAIAEANLIEYLEDILLSISGDSNMLPIWIKIMLL